jgi:flagellar basal-body rod protein FlgB
MASSLNTELTTLLKAMDVRVYRQQIIASNIANADTPNYKARDVAFQDALAEALAPQSPVVQAVALQTSSPLHFAGKSGGGDRYGTLKYRTEKQSSADGNTVDMDVERAQMADNSLQYETLLQFVNNRLSSMRTAISANS